MRSLLRSWLLLMLAFGLVAEGLASASAAPRCAHAASPAPAAQSGGEHAHHAARHVDHEPHEQAANAPAARAAAPCRCRDGCAMPGCALAAPALGGSLLPVRLQAWRPVAPKAAAAGAERAPHASPPIRPPSRT